MRLNPLHNVLFLLTRSLGAEMAAIKLLSAGVAEWAATDVAVGDTAQLADLGWQAGEHAPEPAMPGETRPLFAVDDALTLYQSNHRWAARVIVSDALLAAMPGQFIHHDRRGTSRRPLGIVWLGLGFAAGSSQAAKLADSNRSDLELAIGVTAQAMWTLYHTSQVHADPVTQLPGLADYRSQLYRACADAADDGAGCVLLLIGPDEFLLLRRRFGHEHTNQLLSAFAGELEQGLRKDDGVFRYGDAVFAVVAIVQNAEAAEHLANLLLQRLRDLTSDDHFRGTTTSLGYAFATGQTDPQQLTLSAEQALDQARLRGGNQVIAFSGDFEADCLPAGHAGVFTADPAKDYRNSRTLWHTIELISRETDPAALCHAFVRLLEDSMGVSNLLLVRPQGEDLVLLTDSQVSAAARLSGDRNDLVQQALVRGKTRVHTPDDGATSWLATPLVSRGHSLGCLFLESDTVLDTADQVFLKALADQISGALDRIELDRQETMQSQRERAALRAELKDLRQHLPQHTQLIARSTAMREVLDYIAKIAPSDASVLIMGESGAGKEVMARAIHEASHRADAPLVTVDCSAITHSLIDSELFGRVKGAFTGADEASEGRIAQANGGTLFLDEIGELPLDVQAKLLRFVQEKELIAVGDTQRRIIDTRIICATNRDLLHEATQGRFRSDLYYRLQVLQLTIPPLRERREDLPALVDLFVERYRTQFGNQVQGLTDAAWQKLLDYGWPGNIRELQNAILRATLTASGDVIDASDLHFAESSAALIAAQPATLAPAMTVQGAPLPKHSVQRPTNPTPYTGSTPAAPERFAEPLAGSADTDVSDPGTTNEDDWTMLAAILRGQAQALLEEGAADAPLGRWLADAVVLTAADASDNVARRAAALLGIPETTLRRQLRKARQNAANPFQVTSRQWFATLPALTDILRALLSVTTREGDFTEQCQALLLAEVALQVGTDNRTGAALMGITPPTYARWLRKHGVSDSQQRAAGGAA